MSRYEARKVTLRIEERSDSQRTILSLSGRIRSEQPEELAAQIRQAGRRPRRRPDHRRAGGRPRGFGRGSGKNLTTIYVTHGQGDHFFGMGALLDRNFWSARFPGQIPDQLVIADELEGNVIDLEGHNLIAVEVGHSDTDHTTILHVPSAALVVAGDVAYNDVHLGLGESN